MITNEQNEWLNHLSESDVVEIFPYNQKVPEIFQRIKKRIYELLGPIEVVHRGASSFGISGQNDLDIYVPVEDRDFNALLEPLSTLFGSPRRVYPLERARFVSYIDKTKAEIFLINNRSKGWLEGIKFESYLKNNPKALDDYRVLKEQANGQSTREYYRRKIEFINGVLEKAD